MTPTRGEMIQKIKDRIEYHSDPKKYGYFIGSGIMDYLATDIIEDLQIDKLTARLEKAESENKQLLAELDIINAANIALHGALEQAEDKWNRRAEEKNEPLTLEELRQMDGEPVWCIDGMGNGCWCVVNAKNEDCIDNEAGAWCFAFCGMTGDGYKGLHRLGWYAYRCQQTADTPDSGAGIKEEKK